MTIHQSPAHSTLHLAGAILCAGLCFGATRLAAAQPSPAVQSAQVSSKQAALTPVDNVSLRIKRLHDQLRITPEQETLWAPVASAMQANAKSISDTMQARLDKMPTMNALDDIRSYGAVAQVHAEGLRNLADAFAPLYAAMPPAQQRNADAVFGRKRPAPPRR